MIIISQDKFRLIRDPNHVYADVNGTIRVKVGSDDILMGSYSVDRSKHIIKGIAENMTLEAIAGKEQIYQLPD